ncbi:MAG: GntR family transcriptional regulator [Bacteroides sp.]
MLLKKNLDEQVYEKIVDGIFLGEYTPGQKLDPTELCVEFGISKTPVIQALRRLSHENILELTSGGKYYLPVPDLKSLEDIYDTRYFIEYNALCYLIKNIDKDGIASLTKAADACKESMSKDDIVTALKLDYDFHREIIRLTGNAYLAEIYNMIINKYISNKYTYANGFIKKSQMRATETHYKIITAIKESDYNMISELLHEHIYYFKPEDKDKIPWNPL